MTKENKIDKFIVRVLVISVVYSIIMLTFCLIELYNHANL